MALVDLPMKHISIHIFGNVQGVFFRAHARELAQQLGITGFARNTPEGSLHIEAEGEEKPLQEFVRWCHQGPPAARVSGVKTQEGRLEGFTEFVIRHD